MAARGAMQEQAMYWDWPDATLSPVLLDAPLPLPLVPRPDLACPCSLVPYKASCCTTCLCYRQLNAVHAELHLCEQTP